MAEVHLLGTVSMKSLEKLSEFLPMFYHPPNSHGFKDEFY